MQLWLRKMNYYNYSIININKKWEVVLYAKCRLQKTADIAIKNLERLIEFHRVSIERRQLKDRKQGVKHLVFIEKRW